MAQARTLGADPRGGGAPTLLLIGVSARALAVAARRAGYAPIAIDAFGDADLRAICLATRTVEGAMMGFAGVALEPVVAELCAAYAPCGLVYGSGFDDCPQALGPLARHARILGRPDSMAAAKDPARFAQLCQQAGLRHPQIRFVAPQNPELWLIKRGGGCGGLHVAPAAPDRPLRPGEYWQRRIEGRAVSLLFARDSAALTPIAWSRQWTAPAPASPFRYGGAAGPLPLQAPDGLLGRLAKLTSQLGVRGLASADFVDDGDFWLLEINPRPGATLDVFDADDDPLLARHIAALSDTAMPPVRPRPPKAAAIVYADADAIAPSADWPDWTADRPDAGARLGAGAPVCTVVASGATVAEASASVMQRSARVQGWLREKGR